MKKDHDYYDGLPWRVVIDPEQQEDGSIIFVASHPFRGPLRLPMKLIEECREKQVCITGQRLLAVPGIPSRGPDIPLIEITIPGSIALAPLHGQIACTQRGARFM